MISIAQKVEVIKKVEKGRIKQEISRRYDANEMSICVIYKNNDKSLFLFISSRGEGGL